ncbi:reverse transcriptase domain-containing protein [Pseudomonas cedrina]|uniref:reverse transcriptase domain-containing protein n=1 Tax=Pseudomonas cedrina TaxID=651740 RepID=UPI0027D92939|nr:reverse transcriptase domain-containing protein [Pseudomonas cedrina]
MKKPLKNLFDAMYHGKLDFADFANCDVSLCYERSKFKNREVVRPNKKLKTYHSFLNLFLFEYLRVDEEVVFSYRKGVNAYDAVSKHAGSSYFFQTDLTNFFKSIDSKLVRDVINKSLHLAPILDAESYIDRIVELVVVDGTLPVGFPSSPLISNSCLYEFDSRLKLYCNEHNLIYTRYSDDLIISGRFKDDLLGIKESVAILLDECFQGKLSVNYDKSKFTHSGSKIKLLGMVILPNQKVTVDIKFKKELEVMLHFYINNREKFVDKVGGDYRAGVEKITGYMNYVNTIDKDYLNKLRKKYGATVVDTLIHHPSKK